MVPTPADITSSRPSHNFQLVSSCKSNDAITVNKYRSSRTGLSIVLADIDGPLVHGYFSLGTETFDDDGIPHTLEHLIFLGSEEYPYKGALDTIANRCLADGTNAWTDTDHTAYTVITAGSEGFISLLPIYVDHILYPTLTESGFITEVHHITGEGQNAGVVYCEMQGRETTGESLAEREFMRCLYPGNCGFRYDSGGIVKNLRESTNIVKIREYHKKFYRPENLTLIITGKVNEDDIFNALSPVEEKILSKGYQGEYVKPWQSPVPPLQTSVVNEIKYPCDQEDNGIVYIGWQGPSSTQQYELLACTALMKYLTETAVSPLIRHFVEIPDPYCSDVSFAIIENSVAAVFFDFEDTVCGKIPLIKEELFAVLQKVVNCEPGYEIDIVRMKTVISMWQLKLLSKLEKDSHLEISKIMIGDALYSNSVFNTFERLNPVKSLGELLKSPVEYWKNLIQKLFLNPPSVCILAYPSEEEHTNRTNEEKQRIELQCAALGPEGLKLKAEILENAIRENDKMPPEEMITSVAMPQLNDTISFFSLDHYITDSAQQHLLFDTRDCPVYMQLDDVQSHFIYLIVIMNCEQVPMELRMYIPILMEYILEAPIERNGAILSYEDVAKELETDILSLKTSVGIKSCRFKCGPYSNALTLYIQVDPKNYLKGIQWIREILYCTKFTNDRLQVVANKIINSASQGRRNGSSIVHDLMRLILFRTGTNIDACTALQQHIFLVDMVKKLKMGEDEVQNVINNFEEVRAIITKPENLVIHMAGSMKILLDQLEQPSKYWNNLLPEHVQPVKKSLNIKGDYSILMEPTMQLYKSCVTGMATVDSAFLHQAIPTIHDYNHPDIPALLVYIQYMIQLEGPLWRQIRGLGLAYSYDISPRIQEGILYLTIYKATDVVEAYRKMKEIILERLAQNAWEKTYFDSAKSSLVFEIIEKEKNVKEAISESLYSYLSQTDHGYNARMIQRIMDVHIEDLTKIGEQYVAPLFDNKISRTAVVCHSSKCESVAASFAEMGFNLAVYPTIEESFLNPAYKTL